MLSEKKFLLILLVLIAPIFAEAQTFLMFDNFEDGVVNWKVKRGQWSEQSSTLIGIATNRAAIFTPDTWSPSGESSCSICTTDVDMQTAGGESNRISYVGWYQDRFNRLELIMKEEVDKFVVKQYVNGVLAGRQRANWVIDPGTKYHVQMDFDGVNFNFRIDSQLILTLPAAAPPNGKFGFRIKNTTGSFNLMRVYTN